MNRESSTELLVLHAVRITGFADAAVIAGRFGLDVAEVTEVLLDAEAYGWVQRAAFADLDGWWLTEAGRVENERQLATELTRVDGVEEVRAVHREFVPLNARLQQACTDWQLRPVVGDRFATNDHADAAWDAGVHRELASIGQALEPLAERLARVLPRLRGYDTRFAEALRRSLNGDDGWIDRTDIDSCHRVWFELHEDLIATLGLDRAKGQ